MVKQYDVPVLIEKITNWHYDRNLIEGSTDIAQLKKLREELNELYYSVGKGDSPIDDIGDMIVVLVNIAERNGLTIQECIAHAWGDIKDRTGKINPITGMFEKD